MKVAVVGAGTMGNGIAHVFALNGFSVQLIDGNSKQLENGLSAIKNNLDRQVQKGVISQDQAIQAVRNLSSTIKLEGIDKEVSLVVEAIYENFEAKKHLFEKLDTLVDKHVIVASNTSSISITKLAATISNPSRFLGMHFMNPVPIMTLVEVIKGYHTTDETCLVIKEICEKLQKTAIEVNDYPGFVSNRILMPMINEAIATLHEGVAGVLEIDQIMKLGMAHPMGPLQLADYIGLDICKNILEVLYHGFGNPKYAPNALLVNMVDAGRLGVKSGEGFYVWQKGSKEIVVSSKFSS